MRTRLIRPIRRSTAVVMGLALLGAGAPGTARAADADLRILGGNAVGAVVCGNVAAAQELARQRNIPIQRNRCTASATGGSVTLQNVDVYVSSAALARNRGNSVLAALAATPTPPGVAQDRCEYHRPTPGPGVQINQCWVISRGGRVHLNNVTMIDRLGDGDPTVRTVARATVPSGTGGAAAAQCTNVVNDPLDQRDDCTGRGNGGSWSMVGVDVVIHNADGSTSTRRGVTVEVRGGSADASIYCFNVTDGSGRVVQVNVCNSDAQGGDATLRNVTFVLA